MAGLAFVCLALVVMMNGVLSDDERYSEFVRIMPQPRSYSMHMRGLYECVACDGKTNVQDEFVNCFQRLPSDARKEWNSCCRRHFSSDFCKDASRDRFNFPKVCRSTKKALLVERCMRRKVGALDADILEFSGCKRKILRKHCFTQSED